MGNIGFKELLIVLVVVLLIFGTKRLKNIGKDLGGAVKGFKNAVDDGEAEQKKASAKQIDQQDDNTDADFASSKEHSDSDHTEHKV